MTAWALPVAELAVLGWGVKHIWLRGWQISARRKLGLPPHPELETLKRWCFEHGQNTNAFMALYPGFEYFTHPGLEGAVAYIDTPNAWVGGGEPLGPPSDAVKLLVQFSKAAARVKKRVLLIPIRTDFAERAAAEGGYQPLLVGSDPTFDLKRYPPTGKTWLDVIATAKQLSTKGANVFEFRPDALTPSKRENYDRMVREWLGTRKTAALGFLNQVDPWLYSKEKRYFAIESGTNLIAFVAAIPVRARGGWYLIDVIRKPESPPGSTELLLLQTMRILWESGAKEVTMGVCPLSNIEGAIDLPISRRAEHRLIYRLFQLMYEYGNQFYNFKPLHQFKLKFMPTHSEPVYLIYKDDCSTSKSLGPSDVISIARAWMPGGVTYATGSGVLRMLARFDLGELIKTQLTSKSVVKSVPPNLKRLLSRCRFTAAMVVINLLVYFLTTDSAGNIFPSVEQNWGYTWEGFLAHPIHALILSPFLHWNVVHILTNTLYLFVFTGGLEYLAGTSMTMVCYLAAMLMTNPLTSALLVACVKPLWAGVDMSELDVGASLGIFGTAGAMTWFIKHNRMFFALMIVAVVVDASLTHVLLADNHIVALLIGLLAGKLFLRG